MKRKLFVVAAVIFSSPLLAQDSTRLLDEVVLTANKFEQKQSQTGKVVTVITKEQIEKSTGKNVAQLLTEQAGINIGGVYNAAGSVPTLFMRGGGSGRTLILIDGIPVSDPTMINNEYDLNLFSLNNVERIEILKGAQSTLYGSDAIAGAINIITVKKDVSNPFQVNATTSFGNKNTFRNNLQAYGKAGKLNYTARFAKLRTDGFSVAHDESGNGDFDRDGYDGNVINAAVQYQMLPSLLLKTFILHSQYKADVDDGPFVDEKDFTINNNNFSAGGGIQFKKGIMNITGNYQYGQLTRKYLNDSLYPRDFVSFLRNNYAGRTQYAEVYGTVAPVKWLTILAGADYRWANMTQNMFSLYGTFPPYTSSFKDTSMQQTSVYGSLIFSALQQRLNIEIGGRFNDHSRYGSNGTYTFNPSFIITKSWRVFGSVASGFKTPSIYQLYDGFSGNPDLKPETSVNYEIGIQQTHAKISNRIVYFHRDIEDGLDFNNFTSQYFNLGTQNVDGIEWELAARPIKQLSITANYTFVTGEEQTQSRKSFADTTYDHLLRRPKHMINATVGYEFTPSLFVSVSARSVGERYDLGGYMQNDVLMDGFFIVNAYAEYKWKSQVKFFADFQNITDKKFTEQRGYNSIPFMVSGGISVSL